MSWIKDNKFAAMLGGIALLVALVLFAVGMTYRKKYTKALDDYKEAADRVDEFENLPLYPTDDNRDGKTKALKEYRAEITALRTSFDKFRPKELKDILPQDFTGNVKSAQDEVSKACEAAKTKLPDGFFLGFEDYASGPPSGTATGVLDYQLGAIKHLMLALAQAAPSQVLNFHRPKSTEEDNLKWTPETDAASRAFPMEISFKGTEQAARGFLDALANSPDYFYCVRTLRILNVDPKAPNRADARFDPLPGAGGPGRTPADPFSGAGGFVLPVEDPPAAPVPATPAGTRPAPAGTGAAQVTPAAPIPADAFAASAPAVAARPADSGQILQQILGDEEVQVFLRIDVLQFLKVKELPAVPK